MKCSSKGMEMWSASCLFAWPLPLPSHRHCCPTPMVWFGSGMQAHTWEAAAVHRSDIMDTSLELLVGRHDPPSGLEDVTLCNCGKPNWK